MEKRRGRRLENAPGSKGEGTAEEEGLGEARRRAEEEIKARNEAGEKQRREREAADQARLKDINLKRIRIDLGHETDETD